MTDRPSDDFDPPVPPISPLEAELFTLAPTSPTRSLDAAIASRLSAPAPFHDQRFGRRLDRILLATLSVGLVAAWIAIFLLSVKVAAPHQSGPSAPPANSSLITIEKPRGDNTPPTTQPQNADPALNSSRAGGRRGDR